MGSSSSKPARKLAKEATQTVARGGGSANQAPPHAATATAAAAAAAAAAPSTNQYAPTGHRAQATRDQMAQASETKTKEIMRDSIDPQLLQNLAKLGQVNVPKNSTNFEPTDQMLRILAARERAVHSNLEAPSSSAASASASAGAGAGGTATATATVERMHANTIINLLEDWKHCTSAADVERLAVEYDVSVAAIQSLTRFATSPTLGDEIKDEQGDRESIDRGGEKGPPKVKAVWVEPDVRHQQRISGE